METLSREEVERLMFFEQARDQAEREFHANNRDALALTKWGGALLELAHFRQGDDAYKMMEDAIEKFHEALSIDQGRHDALWCLGNAYTSQGFLSADVGTANTFFDKAGEAFKLAAAQEPHNESYKRAMDMAKKAPALYLELQKQLQAAGQGSPLGEGSRQAVQSVKEASDKAWMGDIWFDVAGWGVLLAVGFGIAVIAQRSAPSA